MADAHKKADAMRRKTLDFQRIFTAADSETVIQGAHPHEIERPTSASSFTSLTPHLPPPSPPLDP